MHGWVPWAVCRVSLWCLLPPPCSHLLLQGFPMALITEACGGVASTGMYNGPILNSVSPVCLSLHDIWHPSFFGAFGGSRAMS